jgi:broad specificity phosphatase PhoE
MSQEMPEKTVQAVAETREVPDFKINIIVHRHGPKEGIAGPLSEDGKRVTKEYFDFVAENTASENVITIEHSPVNRTVETAEIFSESVRASQGNEKIESIAPDERLSEGGVAEHPELIEEYGGRGGKWIAGWMNATERSEPDVKTGQETAADFSDWLLSKVLDRQKQGGVQEIEAFSHGPVMIAFMTKLEEKLGEKLLPPDISLFIGSYLSLMSFSADSNTSDIIYFNFGDKKNIEIPIPLLEEMSRGK